MLCRCIWLKVLCLHYLVAWDKRDLIGIQSHLLPNMVAEQGAGSSPSAASGLNSAESHQPSSTGDGTQMNDFTVRSEELRLTVRSKSRLAAIA